MEIVKQECSMLPLVLAHKKPPRKKRPLSVTVGLIASAILLLITTGMAVGGFLEIICAPRNENSLGFLAVGSLIPMILAIFSFCLTYGRWVNNFPPYGDNYYDGI